MTIGERIKSLRNEKGYTQKELSDLSSLSTISIRKYESGERQPKQKAIMNLAKALDVSEAWLMGYDVPMERKEESNFLADRSNAFSTFIKYLESMKYIVRVEKDVPEAKSKQAKINDSETYTATIINGDVSITLNEDEFELFQANIVKAVEFELFRLGQK